MDPTELPNKLFFVFFGVWVLVVTQATKSMQSMFGSAATTQLTNSSGGSSCKENSAKTPERLHTDPAMAEITDCKLFWTMAESLSPLGCLYTAHCTASLLSKWPYSVRNSSSSLPIISDKAVLIVHNLWLQRVRMKGLHNECDYEI